VTGGTRYLALGDSVTFDYQEPTVVPTPNYHKASTFLGYPEMLGSELHLRVVNVACPGETSASLIKPSAPSNGCENSVTPGAVLYRKSFPLHVHYNGSQLGYAVSYLKAHGNVTLVSLMIGANDLFRCQKTTKDFCISEYKGVIKKVARNVKTMLGAIRNKAHYKGQIVIVNYYSPLTLALYATVIKQLNRSVDRAARPFHVEIADGFGEFAAAARHSASDPCKAGLLTQLLGGGCGVHTSYAGAALLAQAVEKAITL
jgi:lysophospholipase L1-like esterase